MTSTVDEAVNSVIDDITDVDALSKPARPAPYVTAIPAGELFVDHTYQRDLNQARVDRMVNEFDPTLLGVLEVSDRGAKGFAILEGQHRWAAARLAHPHRDLAHLVCQVHRGLTIEEEARLFYDIDVSRRTLSGWDRWKARLRSGDPVVTEIDSIVTALGLKIDPAPKEGHIGASGALELVHQLGGPNLLQNTLNVLFAAYRTARDAYDGSLVHGCALVLHHYDIGPELNLNRLIFVLQNTPPRLIKARATALREAHKGVLPKLTAAVLIDRYNAAPGRNIEEFLIRMPAGSKPAKDPRTAQQAKIRRWAIRERIPVGNERLSQRVIEAYTTAHPDETMIS